MSMTGLRAVTFSICVVAGTLGTGTSAQAFFGLDNPLGGAATGALIGGIAGGGEGALIGAVAGGVVGAAVQDSNKKQQGGQQ